MTFVFVALAVVGLLFLVFSTLVGDHADAGDADHGPGFFSPRTLGVFLTAFGAVGAVSSLYLPPGGPRGLVASLLGVLSGLLLSALYLLAMRMVYTQEASSLVGDQELVGAEGRVTVAIPRDGVGEVTCPVGGQTTRRMARAVGGQAMAEGAAVRITHVYGATVVVEPAPGGPRQ